VGEVRYRAGAVEQGLGRSGGSTAASGSLLTSGWLDGVLVRGNLSYQLRPDPALQSLSLTGEWSFGRDRRLLLGLSHNLVGDGATTVSAGLNWRTEPAIVGLDLNVATTGTIQAGLSLGFGLSREPEADRWAMSADPTAREGTLWARAFLDRDLDGRFGPGDEPLPGVEFESDGLRLPGATDARGVALLHLAPDQHVEVALRPESLEDPSWVPAREGVRLVPRSGRGLELDFPVVATGEVEGRTLLRLREGSQEIANVSVQLVAGDGRVAAEVRSEFDGAFLFERVRPGPYTLRVAPEQAARLHLLSPPEKGIAVRSGDSVRGLDLVLEKRGDLGDGSDGGDGGDGRPGRPSAS
jgi:hypothetical protein